MLRNLLLTRPLKKVQMQGGARYGGRGVLGSYVAAPRERAGYPSGGWVSADGPFSAACYRVTGRWTVKVVPRPTWLSTSMLPLWSSMIRWVMAMPSPRPFSLVV